MLASRSDGSGDRMQCEIRDASASVDIVREGACGMRALYQVGKTNALAHRQAFGTSNG